MEGLRVRKGSAVLLAGVMTLGMFTACQGKEPDSGSEYVTAKISYDLPDEHNEPFMKYVEMLQNDYGYSVFYNTEDVDLSGKCIIVTDYDPNEVAVAKLYLRPSNPNGELTIEFYDEDGTERFREEVEKAQNDDDPSADYLFEEDSLVYFGFEDTHKGNVKVFYAYYLLDDCYVVVKAYTPPDYDEPGEWYRDVDATLHALGFRSPMDEIEE